MSDAAKSAREGWSEEELAAIERAHPRGMTVQQIVDAFATRGEKLTEATFRKYVQLGLLPRSVRVARKGKRRGSQGLYPASAVRQIDAIRRLMSQGYTMEEIQREFLFIRGDIEELAQKLERIYTAVESALAERGNTPDDFAAKQLAEAKALGRELLGRLEGIEKRMSMRARMARAAV
ncbi:MAG TPA: MerR family transcriptional regulator [Sandaracinaceae bacterium]